MAETDLRELDLLLEQLCDELLDQDPDAASRLFALLDVNETCRRRYINMLELHATLWTIGGCGDIPDLTDSVTQMVSGEEIAIQESGEAPSLPNSGHRAPCMPAIWHTPLTYLSSGWPMAYLIAIVILGVGILIGSITYVSLPAPIAQKSSPTVNRATKATPNLQLVGRITGMADCGWRDAQKSHSTQVALGDAYSLHSGLLEITYDSGARVVLQGPVTYRVESHNGGFLSIGKATGIVEGQKARGFTVRTPTAVVKDLGTEFGVEVDEHGATISHVFRGRIKLESVSVDGRAPADSRILRANESARVAKTGDDGRLTVRAIAVDPAMFVRAAAFPKPVGDMRLTPFSRWQRYSEQLRKDPSLLAYYDFQLKPGSPSVLANVAANGDRSLDGVVENATWTTGRMPGKHALLFNGPADCVRVNLPDKLNDMTMAVWVNVYSLDNACNGILMSDQWMQEGQIHWQITADGDMQYGLLGSGTNAVPVFRSDRLCKWTHLAMTYDRAAGELRMYVNGRLAGMSEFPRRTPVCFGPARIGHWNSIPFDRSQPARNLHGRIDELAIFRRLLTADELMQMYEQGRPADGREATRPSP